MEKHIQFPQPVKNWVQSNAGRTRCPSTVLTHRLSSASMRGQNSVRRCDAHTESNTRSLRQDGRRPAGVKLGVTASRRESAVPLCDLTDQREADSWGFLYTSLKSHPHALFISFLRPLHFLIPRHPRPANTGADPLSLPSILFAPAFPASPISICLIQRPDLWLAAVWFL